MKRWGRNQTGFTIVELLIVVVVIAIIAAITIVSYTGIRERATIAQVQSALSQANKKVLTYAALNADQYPVSLADAGVSDTSSAIYQYSSDNNVSPSKYAITATNSIIGGLTYYISSTQTSPVAGIAPGHNLMPWQEPNSGSAPFNSTGVTIDTAEYNSAPASLRFAVSSIQKNMRVSPITGNAGQVVRASLWVKTEAVWNGTGGNSKIRFGAVSDNALLHACAYNGVKTTWTQIACQYTLTPSNTSVLITAGNDGSVGTIWIDDVSVTIQ